MEIPRNESVGDSYWEGGHTQYMYTYYIILYIYIEYVYRCIYIILYLMIFHAFPFGKLAGFPAMDHEMICETLMATLRLSHDTKRVWRDWFWDFLNTIWVKCFSLLDTFVDTWLLNRPHEFMSLSYDFRVFDCFISFVIYWTYQIITLEASPRLPRGAGVSLTSSEEGFNKRTPKLPTKNGGPTTYFGLK